MSSSPAVSFQNVTKQFGKELVLHDVSIDLLPSELTFIMGPSGVGKSVFLKLALGFERPNHGKVLLNGKDLRTLKRKALRHLRTKNILIFQMPALFDFLSVLENVCFPYLEHFPKESFKDVTQKAEAILSRLGFKADPRKPPETVTESEAKIVVIARALMLNPDYLFFDEPTTGLDEVTRSHVDDEIRKVNTQFQKGCTVISHDVRSAMSIADRIIFLHDKKIYADTRQPRDLLEHPDDVIRNFFKPGMLF